MGEIGQVDVVCVPVKVDAFVLNESLFDAQHKSKIAPLNLPDYAGLGTGASLRADVVPPVDIHAATPITSNTRVTDVCGTGQVIEGRLGVYLHWILPKAFRTGITASASAIASGDHEKNRLEHGFPAAKNPSAGPASDAPEFRPVPDRWFIFRLLTPIGDAGDALPTGAETFAAFVLESNRLRTLDEFDPDADIEMEAAPFLDHDGPAHEQDDVLMGCKYDFAKWAKSSNDAKRYHIPLTIANSSNTLFPDYQPHNINVFSLHDDLTYIDANGNQSMLDSCACTYFVFGYYEDAKHDPFYWDRDLVSESRPKQETILNTCSMKLQDEPKNSAWLKAKVDKSRLACHGAVYEVRWDRNRPPGTIPADIHAEIISREHPVAVGIDSVDALESFIEAHDDVEGESSVIHSIAKLVKSEHDDIHKQRQAEKDMLRRQFRPVAGGLHWHSSTVPADANSNDVERRVSERLSDSLEQPSKEQGQSMPFKQSIASRPSDAEHVLVHELNILQYHYDSCLRHRDHLQSQLYAEWWKCRAEITDNDDEIDNPAENEKHSTLIKYNTETLSRQTNLLGGPGAKSGILSELEARIAKIAAHPIIKNCLKSGTNPEFQVRKDPAMVILNMRSSWPHEFISGDLQVRLRSHLPLSRADLSFKVLPEKWKQSVRSAVEANDIRSCLNIAAVEGFDVDDVSQDCDDGVRTWLLNWSKILSLARCDRIPSDLQDTLVDLLIEWVFLDYTDYDVVDKMLTPEFLQQQDDTVGKSGETELITSVKGPSIHKSPPARLSWNNTQAWFPLFIEWEIEYYHVPFQYWELRPSDGIYGYGIRPGTILSKIRGIRDDVRIVSGRCMILPQVTQMLRAHVERILKQARPKEKPVGEANNSENKGNSSETDFNETILSAIDHLPFLSATLDGFTSHLLTWVGGAHVAPHANTESKYSENHQLNDQGSRNIFSNATMNLLIGADSDVSPYGNYLDLQHHRRDGKDVAFSPFKSATHGQARFRKLNLVDKFGQVVPAIRNGRDGEPEPFLPYQSSAVSCTPNGFSEPYLSNTIVQGPEGLCEFFQLQPAINQPSRLNAFFVVENEEEIEFPRPWRATNDWENPIWGWLIVNFRDGALQVFKRDGSFLAEALLRNKKVYWRPSGISNFLNTADSDDSDDDLTGQNDAKSSSPKNQLEYLLEQFSSEKYLQDFMDTIVEGLETLHHAPNSYADAVPAIFGRPLALVNVGWSLELASPPLDNQSNVEIPAKSILDYEFDLKIGDKESFHDGVIGYFMPSEDIKETSGKLVSHFDYSTLCTDFPGPKEQVRIGDELGLKRVSQHMKLKPYYINPSICTSHEYVRMQNKAFRVVSVVVDPFSVITGYSGILPPKQLQVPPFAVEAALMEISPFINAGPALIPGDTPDRQLLSSVSFGTEVIAPPNVHIDPKNPPSIPVHLPDSGNWMWLQPHALDPDAEDVEYRQIQPSTYEIKYHPTDGPHTAVEGFLQLKAAAQPNPESSLESRISLRDFGQVFANPWGLDFSGRGSCGGLPNEVVDLVVSLSLNKDPELLDMASKYPLKTHFKIRVVMQLPGGKSNTLSTGRLGLHAPCKIKYTRPAEDYTIHLTAEHEEIGLVLIFRWPLPVDKSRTKVLSAEMSEFRMPTKLPLGTSREGIIILRDRCNNVVRGYDDRNLLDFEGWPETPEVSYSDTGCSLYSRYLPPGKREVSVLLAGTSVEDPILIEVLPPLDLANCIVRGNGLCSGIAGEAVKIEILLIDESGKTSSDRLPLVEISSNNGAPQLVSVKGGAGALSDWQVAKFIRPAIGKYTISIKCNEMHLGASPYRIVSTSEPVPWDPTKVKVQISRSTLQTVSISLFDKLGSTLSSNLTILRKATLALREVLRENTSNEAVTCELAHSRGDGLYTGNLQLPIGSIWICSVVLELEKQRRVVYRLSDTLRTSDQGDILVRVVENSSEFETIKTTKSATILTVPWSEWVM